MIETRFLNALRTIYSRLHECRSVWAVTGSLGMALQGMDIVVHDIDLQTDKQGAYAMESLLEEYSIAPVKYKASERICSFFGVLEINGVRVEIMGDLQKKLADETWENPVKVEEHQEWVEFSGMTIPVLSLVYEYQAYLMYGRYEKAEKIKKWLESK
jgi:hypothetical protein